MSSPTVYLAGPIDGLTYSEATDWRREVTTVLAAHGFVGVDPMRGKDFLAGQVLDKGTEGREPYQHPMALDKGIMGRDHYDCVTCDLMFANFLDSKKPSLGTAMECAWRYMARKPVIAILEPRDFHDHPMLRETWSYAVTSLVQAVEIAKHLLAPYR